MADTSDARFCTSCGTKLNDEGEYCFRCGVKVAPVQREGGLTADPRESNWFRRHLRELIGGAVALVLLVAVVDTLPDKSVRPTSSPGNSSAVRHRLFHERSGAQPGDQERAPGDVALVDDLAATVYPVSSTGLVGFYRASDHIVVPVGLVNESHATKSYSWSDWKIQLPSGVIEDADPPGMTLGGLDSAGLAPGGKTGGRVVLPTNGESGDFYIIWQPTLSGDERGIWKMTL